MNRTLWNGIVVQYLLLFFWVLGPIIIIRYPASLLFIGGPRLDAILLLLGSLLFMMRQQWWATSVEQIRPRYIFRVIAYFVTVLSIVTSIWAFVKNKSPLDWLYLNHIFFLYGIAIVVIVVPALARAMHCCVRDSPLEFHIKYQECEQGFLFPPYYNSTETDIGNLVRKLCGAGRDPAYIRRQARGRARPVISRIRLFVLWVVVPSLPLLLFAFSLISASGQTLHLWTIVHTIPAGNTQETVAAPLLIDHLYFCASVVSTMGIGDSRPVIDNSRLGECLLLSILLIAMLTSLIVVALLVSFIHSILPAWDSEIGHLISDSCRCRSIASVADAGNEKPFQ